MNFYIKYVVIIFTLGLAIPGLSAIAADQVYGWELMTKKERAEHTTKMQAMKTEQEREKYRMEHHKKMDIRATKKGVKLKAMPKPMGKGMGSGGGAGNGSGGGGGRGR
jgi:hypothetical protein